MIASPCCHRAGCVTGRKTDSKDGRPPSQESTSLRIKREISTRKTLVTRYYFDMSNVADVIENALSLSVADRSYVASKLIESLENEKLSVEQIAGYDQRVANWKAGANPSTSSEELDAKVQAILQS